MAYDLFLIDADDTLFDFKSAERQAFTSILGNLIEPRRFELIFQTYRAESEKVWRLLEINGITKEELKVERFRRTFQIHEIELDPGQASEDYLEALSQADNLNDHAFEICRFLSEIGEVGIVTNGIVSVQKRRLAKSPICKFVSFLAVSEECGFSKPDRRFFEYSVGLAKGYLKESTLVIGDRLDTDIAGAHGFGLDACLFNPERRANTTSIHPRFEIGHLSELREIAFPLVEVVTSTGIIK